MQPPEPEPGYINGELTDKIWRQIDDSGDCWIWTAGCTKNGYGVTSFGGSRWYVHRLLYEALVGEIPPGMVIDHRCHNKRCCRPSHLLPCDQTANTQNRRGAQRNSKSGIRGVYPCGGKWRVQVKANGRINSGGVFTDLQEAAEAARALRRELMPGSQD